MSFFDHLSISMWIFLDHLPTSSCLRSHWISQKANDILRESLRIDKLKSKRLCLPWDFTQVLTNVVTVCENLTFIHLPFELNKIFTKSYVIQESDFQKWWPPTLRYLFKEHACWRILGKFSTLSFCMFSLCSLIIHPSCLIDTLEYAPSSKFNRFLVHIERRMAVNLNKNWE